MAGVEDIPGVVMTDGLPWTWETFPEFLDALSSRPRDIDVAALLPHSPLRVYVMGQRGVDREPATAEDLSQMRKLAAEAVAVGALGFASSRLTLHESQSGLPIPSFEAGRDEIEAIARGVDDAGGGLIQFVPDLVAGDYGPALRACSRGASAASISSGTTTNSTCGKVFRTARTRSAKRVQLASTSKGTGAFWMAAMVRQRMVGPR